MAATFTHNQYIASDTWIVPHNMGKKPSVTVVNSCGLVVDYCDVDYVDNNKLIIMLSGLLIGKAYLNK